MAEVPDNTNPEPDARQAILESYVERPPGATVTDVTETWQEFLAGFESSVKRHQYAMVSRLVRECGLDAFLEALEEAGDRIGKGDRQAYAALARAIAEEGLTLRDYLEYESIDRWRWRHVPAEAAALRRRRTRDNETE